MSRRLIFLISVLLFASAVSRAQTDLDKEFFSLPDSVTNEYLDSVSVEALKPNNYLMIGVYGGASAQMGFFNPDRNTNILWAGPVLGFSIVRYYKMFGIFPNMGIEWGAQLNYEGYEFKFNEESGYRPTESGAYKLVMKVPEVFALSHFHFDFGEYFKILAKLGIYGGYRTSISRTLDETYIGSSYEQYVNQFRDYDKRWTYGVQGGVGMALMFSPVEIHLNARIKWGWESFWEPDYASKYYYRFAYPLDAAITLGVYYQLTPRYGRTRSQLKQLARKMVQEQKQQHE